MVSEDIGDMDPRVVPHSGSLVFAAGALITDLELHTVFKER